jgi:hypothetical protein
MRILPPGTILQLMYLRERLINIQQRRFIEAGPGEYDFQYRQFNQPLVNAEQIARNQFKTVAPEMVSALDYKITYRK